MTDLLQIAGQFDVQGKPRSCEAYGTGHIHQTFLLESDENRKYILQRLNTNVFNKPEAVLDNISRILEFLKNSGEPDYGFLDLEIVESRNGKAYCTDDAGDFWRCYHFIENSITIETVENSTQAFEGARSFGYFISRLKNYNPRRLHITIPNFRDLEWRKKQLAFAELTNPGPRLKQVESEIHKANLLWSIPENYLRIALALPARVTHNDPKLTNILFDADTGKGISVIDLDTVMPGTLLTDFGDMVRSFTVSGKEDDTNPDSWNCREDLFEGLVFGFLEAVSPFLTDLEKSNLLLGAKVIIYLQAIRFLIDYISGDKYYKTDYPEQNLLRTRNQLNLLESVIEKEEKLQGIIRSVSLSGKDFN